MKPHSETYWAIRIKGEQNFMTDSDFPFPLLFKTREGAAWYLKENEFIGTVVRVRVEECEGE